MLFGRSRSVAVLLSLIGSVWCATTPVPDVSQGHWLRGRTQGERGIQKTVQSVPSNDSDVLRSDGATQTDNISMVTNTEQMLTSEKHTRTSLVPSKDYPESTGVLHSDGGTQIDDISEVTYTEQMSTSEEPTRTSLVSSDDHPMPTSDLDNNSTAGMDATSNGGTTIDETALETERHTLTTFFRTVSTDDEYRTRRGIVQVDDDFNVSPESTVDDTKHSKTSTTDEGSGQEEPSTTPDHTSPDFEGSGDDEVAEQWHFCLNATCDSQDMSVFPGHDEMVPVGTNLSLSCVQSNESVVGLRWYKYDDAGNPVLQADVDRELELTLAIHKSKTEDSGRYVCVRASTGSCCHRTLHVKVYEVPNYRYHLIVVGVVAAVSLFACLLLAVCRNYKTKKYEVQLELQNMESDCMYKM